MAADAVAARRRGLRALPLLTVAALLWGSAVGLQGWREERHPLPPVSSDVLYFRGGAAVSRAALGFDAILADIYWIRSIQHFGGTRRAQDSDRTYKLLYPLLDLTTTLDPHFSIAYRFGALFLSESYPAGPGRSDLAIALLERGLAADPTRWQYAQDAGFVYYWYRQDYKAAAEWYDRASRIEGAPWWLRSMAASVLAEGGDRGSSRQMWQRIYETVDDSWVRDNAQLKLLQLRALDEMDELASLVGRYTQVRGAPPQSWNDLVAARWLAGIPVDPSGTPYELKPGAADVVALAERSKLSPLPPQFLKKAGPRT